MASWSFTDAPNYITVTRDSHTFRVSKFSRITLTVDEPMLYFNYSDNNPILSSVKSETLRKKDSVNVRQWDIDYTDVSSPVVASATALKALLESWGITTGGSGPITTSLTVFTGADFSAANYTNALLSGLTADSDFAIIGGRTLKLTTDYTFSGTTITLTSGTPASDETFLLIIK